MIAAVMAMMCASLNLPSNEAPRWPDVSERDALSHVGRVRDDVVVGGDDIVDVDEVFWKGTCASSFMHSDSVARYAALWVAPSQGVDRSVFSLVRGRGWEGAKGQVAAGVAPASSPGEGKESARFPKNGSDRLSYEMSVTEDRDCVVRRNTVGWFDSIEHNRWLSAHMQALIEEAEGAIVATGFAHLDADGKPDPTRSIDLAVTGRMAYVFSLGALMGLPGTRRYADHAVKALTNYFTDPVNGGMWFAIKPEPDTDGRGVPWDEDARVKSQYHTVYALLGVAAATVANRPGAHELLNRMLEEQKELWADDYGLVWDQYDEAFNEPVPRPHPRHPHPHDRGLHGRGRGHDRARVA